MPQQNSDENAAREQQILDAASDLFIRYGYDKTTMQDIAEHAGVTRAIV
jgi:AcrR family transcriptional regulator